ncbi:MAG TPA: hypothetical protein VE046_14665 [Steroidobacteraceae bacterium]|nr:hypothetical protein [Steroidobacteraceae bacterium]
MSLNKALPHLFLIVAAAAMAQISLQLRSLPPVLATKFDFEGAPVAWMKLGAVRMFEFSLLVIFLFGFWLLPRLLAHRPTTYWRIPNRDYWLAPERRGQTIEALHGLISWMGVVVLLLFMAVTQLVFDANLRTPPHLASDALIWLLLSFVLFIVMWIWVIVRQFGRVP